MKMTKKITILAAAAAMTLAMSGAALAEGHVFGYTCMDMTNPFHIAMRDAMQEAIEALVSLGYSRAQAVNAVKSVAALGDTTEELVLYALKALDKR